MFHGIGRTNRGKRFLLINIQQRRFGRWLAPGRDESFRFDSCQLGLFVGKSRASNVCLCRIYTLSYTDTVAMWSIIRRLHYLSVRACKSEQYAIEYVKVFVIVPVFWPMEKKKKRKKENMVYGSRWAEVGAGSKRWLGTYMGQETADADGIRVLGMNCCSLMEVWVWTRDLSGDYCQRLIDTFGNE